MAHACAVTAPLDKSENGVTRTRHMHAHACRGAAYLEDAVEKEEGHLFPEGVALGVVAILDESAQFLR